MVQLSWLKACSNGTATALQLDETRAIRTEDLLMLWSSKCLALRFRRNASAKTPLESKACVKLNLTPSAYGGEYSAGIFGEITRWILKNGISVPAQGERTLRVAGDCKIGVVE
jgi:hypothetical protein